MQESNPIIDRKIAAIRKIGRKDLSVGEVQAILGYATPYPIVSDTGLIARHKIVAAKIGGQWRIDAASFEVFISNSISVLPL